jgi:hypothetical protein
MNKKLILFLSFVPLLVFGDVGLGPIPTANLYTNSGSVSVWGSFITIAIALITMGFAIRAVVLVKLAVTGERNPLQLVWTLIVAVMGFAIVRALL